MFTPARVIESSQVEVHPNLEAIVQKHLTHTYRKPIADHTKRAFEYLVSIQDQYSPSIIFDSCCGTGLSTYLLAERHLDAWIIGIDRSEKRLERGRGSLQGISLPSNITWVQADCADLWRLAEQNGWRLDNHYILYPNPYPKPPHIQRRWHAHAAFPSLLALGGCLEVRSNWELYIREMAYALDIAGIKSTVECFESKQSGDHRELESYLTLFEKKYALSGHDLWSCKAHL